MTEFTIEASFQLPVFRARTYTAVTLDEACQLAIDDEDWSKREYDHDNAGPTYVTGAWPGADTAYLTDTLVIPADFKLASYAPPHSTPADRGRFVVGVAYLCDREPFATEEITVSAFRIDYAEGLALQLARSSVYYDERIPKLGCALTLSAELVGRAGDPSLERAREALSDCLDDLDAWSASGPENYSDEEIVRRQGYEAVLDQITAECSVPPLRILHPRFDRTWAPPVYGKPLEGPMRTYSVLLSIYSGEEILVEEIYLIDAPNEIQAEHLAIDRSDYSPHWRDGFDEMSRSALATEVKPPCATASN